MVRKKLIRYGSIVFLFLLFMTLTGCDLYNPADRQNKVVQEANREVDYLDGKDPVVSDVTGDTEVSSKDSVDTTVESHTTTSVEEDQNLEEQMVPEENLLEDQENNEEVISASEEDKEVAKELNSNGYSLYQEGKYQEALALFKSSLTKDQDYFYAHFNYACTLGVLMKEDYALWYESKDEIIDELKICLEIDPSSKSKIINDSDLELVKNDFDYLTAIAGYDLTTTDGLLNILKQSKWYVHGNGAISVLGDIDFDGQNVTFSYINLEKFDEGIVGDPIVSSGVYTYDGSKITFTMNKPMLRRRSLSDIYSNYSEIDDRTQFTGTLSEDGILTIDGFDYQIYNWYEEFSA